MSRATTARRIPWTLDEWTAFGARCQTQLRQLRCATKAVEKIPGVSASLLDSAIKASNTFLDALWQIEKIMDLDGIRAEAMRVFWKDLSTVNCEREWHAPRWRGQKGAGRKGRNVIMPRWAWNLEGRRFKTIREDLIRLHTDLSNGQGKTRTRSACRSLRKVEHFLDRTRCQLDSLLCKQHPRWERFAEVFYGRFKPLPFQHDGTIDYARCDEAELGESPQGTDDPTYST